jgi:hypothetical protein
VIALAALKKILSFITRLLKTFANISGTGGPTESAALIFKP